MDLSSFILVTGLRLPFLSQESVYGGVLHSVKPDVRVCFSPTVFPTSRSHEQGEVLFVFSMYALQLNRHAHWPALRDLAAASAVRCTRHMLCIKVPPVTPDISLSVAVSV